MFKHCCVKLRARLKRYDLLDVAMWSLTIAVVTLVAVIGYAMVNPAVEPWNGLSYVIPAQVIEEDNTVPTSFVSGDEVPVRITRVTDCVAHICPPDGLPTLVNVRWQLLEDGVEQTTSYAVLSDFEQVLEEGRDYRVGESLISTIQLNPIPVPAEVSGYSAVNGGASEWRIEGEVVPLVTNASPVPWQTQSFMVVVE